jgi:hypothetical protein
MRRFWSWAILIVVVLGVVAGGTPAQAGGSTFSFHNRWFAPGQVAAGRTQFGNASNEAGRVSDGPYFAYLIRGDRWIEPPLVPRNAIRLAQIRMSRAANGFWWASVRFVVPNVRPGQYMVSMCNDPCRSSNVGDLVGGWIFIASSSEQAKLKNMESRIADRVMVGMSQQLEDMSVQIAELRDAMGTVPPSGVTVGTQLRLDPIEEQLKVMAAQVRDLRGKSDQGLPAWLWLSGWIVAAGTAVVWRRTTVRRRTRAEITPTSDEVTWMEATPSSSPGDGLGAPRSPGELVTR